MADAPLSFPRFRSRFPWWGRDLQTLRNYILNAEPPLADYPAELLEFPLSDGTSQATVVANLDVFKRTLSADGPPQRVIFAAQLDGCRYDPQREPAWQIVLQPATGFLWASPDRLQALGVEVDPATKKLLAEQAGRLGIAP